MEKPKSRIIESGYINIYSKLNDKEKRQIYYNRQYKKIHPGWDNTAVQLCKMFDGFLIENYRKKEINVLDAGCGNGNYVIDEFRTKINWACGVDVDEKSTEKNVCLDEIKHSNLEKIPYPDNEFNAVLSLWVIEHLTNPVTVFREIHRVLKPGGVFYFATPNKNFLPIKIKRFIKSNKINLILNKILYGRDEKDVFPTSYKSNDIDSLMRNLKKAGFKNIGMRLNYDPGYLSFDKVTFSVSNFLNLFFEKRQPAIFKPHIIGIAVKPE